MKKVFAFLKKRKIFTASVAVLLVAACTMAWIWALVFTRLSKGTVPTDADLANAVRYERVVVFGVDGAGGRFGTADAPDFHRIFDGGSVTYTGWSQYPTSSAPNWTSMLHGVRYQKHKVSNAIAASRPYVDEKYPSVFKIYSERHPDAQLLSAVSKTFVNDGCIEDLDALVKITGGALVAEAGADDPMETVADRMVTDALLEKLADETFDPKITFVHFGQVDRYGHIYGSDSEEYDRSITLVDGYLGRIYDAFRARGWEENTLFILATDHGHRVTTGHGTNGKRERRVTVAVNGKLGNVIGGRMGKVVTQDVAAIVLYALGEKQPDDWDAKVPEDVFNTL